METLETGKTNLIEKGNKRESLLITRRFFQLIAMGICDRRKC